MMDVSTRQDSFSCGKWNLTEEEYTIKNNHGWWVQGLASLMIGLIGIVLSSAAIIVLSDRKLNGILFNRLIICMTSFEIIYSICSMFDAYRFNFIDYNIYCPVNEVGFIAVFIAYPLKKIMMCCVVYMTLVVAFERYSAATNPISHRNRSTYHSLNRRTIKYVSITCIVSVLYGLPLFFAFQIKKKESGSESKECRVGVDRIIPWLRNEPFFVIFQNNVTDLLVTVVIPFTLMAFFYFQIYSAIKDGMKSRDQMLAKKISSSSTKSRFSCNAEKQPSDVEERKNELIQSIILIWIVISFLICQVPRVTLNIEEMVSSADRDRVMAKAADLKVKCTGVKFWSHIIGDWSLFLLNLTPTMNFFIYCYFSKKFKDVLKSKLLSFFTFGKSGDTNEDQSGVSCSVFQCFTADATSPEDTTELIETKKKIEPTERTPLKSDLN